jgi:hypothetical protein
MKSHKTPKLNCFNRDDWCHLCGYRNDMYFVTMDIPENAEHSRRESRMYLRLCQYCIQDFGKVIQDTIIAQVDYLHSSQSSTN